MKNQLNKSVLVGFLIPIILAFSIKTNAQIAFDTASNFYKTDLPPGWSDAPEITTNQTWEGYRVVMNPVHVPEGKTLTITGKVAFTSSGGIIVDRGGQLILDSAFLTNTCGDLWMGIQVLGSPDYPPVTEYQGKVIIMNGTLIEHARNAIVNCLMETDPTKGDLTPNLAFTGGIVEANDAFFKNNKSAAEFYKYPATGYGYPSTCSFTNCQFITDEFYEGDTYPGYFVRLNELNKIKFNSCTFINATGTDYTGSGIFSFSSHFTAEGVFENNQWTNGRFINLDYGIYAIGSGIGFAGISHNNFENNFHGVYMGATDQCSITSNYFYLIEPWEENGGYGLYLDRATGFWVEDNDFQGSPPHTIGVGIVVNNADREPNEIYRNRFTRLECGIEALYENKLDDGTGLVFRCNDYSSTGYDEVVTWDKPKLTQKAGIATSQGYSSSNPEDMAGNLFQIDGQTPNGDYDDILNEANHITYYVPQFYNDIRVIPVDYTENTVTPMPVPFNPNNPWTYEDGCPPSDDPGGGGDIEDTKNSMANAGQKIDSTQNLLTILIDGGNTYAVQTDVETSIPPETMQVYNDLMNKSPYLSDTVISTAIEKEDVLPGAMIRDIMVANPKAAKSEKLMQKLDDRWNPLPDYMKAQILQGRSIVSIREETESRLAAFKLEKAKYFNALARYYLNDTVNPLASHDSLAMLFQNENGLNGRYSLAMLKGGQGAWSEGLGILNNIPAQFELTPAEAEAHSQITAYYNLLSDMAQQGKSIFKADSTQVETLFGIEANQSGMAGVYARNILLALNLMEYEEPVILPDLLKSSAAVEEYENMIGRADEAPEVLTVQPNPAKDYVTLGYEFERQTAATIEITGISGNKEYSVSVNGQKDRIVVDTSKWKAGVYIAVLKVNEQIIVSVKFTVVN